MTDDEIEIQIDSDACQGHGVCYSIAPVLIGYDDDGYAKVIRLPSSPDEGETLRRAASACPERAITLTTRPPLGG